MSSTSTSSSSSNSSTGTGSFFYPTSWTVDVIQPKFYIYRRGGKWEIEPLKVPYTLPPTTLPHLLDENGFFGTERIVLVTHGFRNTIDTPWMNQIKDELLKETDQTVILLGWGNGADLVAPHYLQAAANIQSTSDWLSEHLIEIMKFKSDLKIWGVGHSLGAHLLGLAGRKSKAFKRISGLDPAGPSFEKHEFMKYRLQADDALEMTDVIHTDGYDSFLDPEDWFSPVNHYGTLIPLGTIDFYPNFGYSQPGTGPISTLTIAGSHLRAIDLYIWSINNSTKFQTGLILNGTPGFESPVKEVIEAETPAEMGYHAVKSPAKSGYYYLKTNKKEPWDMEDKDDEKSGGDEPPAPGGGGCVVV